jgi:hypothetical protein
MVQAVINSTGTYFEVIPTSNIYQTQGKNINVQINVTNAPAHVYSWQLELYYNASVLHFVSAVNGSFIPYRIGVNASYFDYSVRSTANAQINYTDIAMTYVGSTLGSGPGNGWLCNVTFTVVATTGWSNLHLQNTELISTSSATTFYLANDGFFSTTQPVHDIAITNVVANATWPVKNVTQGVGPQDVGINVTIYNAGSSSPESFWVNVTAHPTDPREPVVSIGNQSSSALTGHSTTLTFTWNTAGVNGQIYYIWSNATIIGAPDKNQNNNLYIGPIVRVVSPYNIKVAGVTVLGPLFEGYPTVHKGQNANVNVTAADEGQNPETFNVTVWANSGSGFSSVAKKLFNMFPNDINITETATWNTTGMTPGVYTIMANATAVLGETDLADNQITATNKLQVIIDDVGIVSVATQNYGEWINVTVKNYGTVGAYYTVYVWAVNASLSPSLFNTSWTYPASRPPEPMALLVGEIEGPMYLAAGNTTVPPLTNLDPYLRMPYGRSEKTLWSGTDIPFPYAGTALTPGAKYTIWVVVVKTPSYAGDVDDNLANNWFKAGNVTARFPGDYTFNGHIGSGELTKVLGYYGTYESTKPAVYEKWYQLDFYGGQEKPAVIGSGDLTLVLGYYGKYYGPNW